MTRNRQTLAILALAALIVITLVAGTTIGRPAPAPAAGTTSVSAIAEECRRALSYPARTAADRVWLRQCVHALTPPTGAPTPTPTVNPTTPAPTPTTTVDQTPTPPPTTTPPAAAVHGRDITQANTGWAAWTGAAGQRCTEATMTVYATRVPASQLGAAATCVWLQAGIHVDAPITLTAARIDTTVRSDGPRLTIAWSTIDGHGDGTYSVGGHNVDVTRSQIVGSSDGVRLEGMALVEDWIRVAQTDPADHNDAIQAYQASAGGSILRCNIDGRPTNATAGVFGNAAIFLADNSVGEVEIRDNYLAGGGYTLRLHEAQTYRVTGNVIADWGYGPVSTSSAIPGAWLEWSGNVTAAGEAVNP